MKITEDQSAKTILLQNMVNKEVREGIHLSDLDLCLKKAYYGKTARLPLSEDSIVKFFLGWAAQHELAGTREETKVEKDGIQMSLDVMIDGTFMEIKTYGGSPGGYTLKGGQVKESFSPASMEHWMKRAKGYLCAIGQTYCYFGVVFLVPVRVLKVYKVEFTEDEIERNWEEVIKRRNILGMALRMKVVPEPDYHQEWECRDCENNVPGRCYRGG